MAIPRTRGMLSGTLLVLLGIWGGLVPFVGPYFNYAYTPDKTWTYSTGRLWLDILPGGATVIGGLLLLVSRRRHFASFGAVLAAVSGVWFVVGSAASTLWTSGGATAAGTPVGTSALKIFTENIGFFAGLGVVIVFLAALGLGRLTIVATRDATPASAVPAEAGTPADDKSADDKSTVKVS